MRRCAIPIVLVTVLLLAGCVSEREVPEPIADTEIQRILEERLDAAWANTGLEGIVPRPTFDADTIVDRYRTTSNFTDLAECLQERGIENWGIEERDGGPFFIASSGSPAEPASQLAWYRCFAEHPSDSSFSGMMLSAAESDYLYDYYQEWVMPCLRLKGYEFSYTPTRAEFTGSMYQGWIPYYYVSSGPGFDYQAGLDRERLATLADQCGHPFPGLQYGEQYGF